MTNQAMQVVLTAGHDDLARATLGFQAALSALLSGAETSVFLTLDATEWACEPRPVGIGQQVYEILDQLTELQAGVYVCSACAAHQCTGGDADGDATGNDIQTTEGIALRGLTFLLERTMAGVPTITF